MNQSLWIPYPSCPVGVQFDSVRERHSHQLLMRHDSDVLEMVQSIEGAGDEAWPDSPVFQQVEPCELGEGRQGIVAVGLGGTSHWSMAIDGDLAVGLKFDVACRVSESPSFLGSSYRMRQPINTINDSRVEWNSSVNSGGRVDLELLQGSLTVTENNRRLVILADPVATGFPATIRWGYRLFFVGNLASA